ncbi:MAG: GGDEF domain-containing protein [Lachnospiraceae bacterium]|nr:GGDEF domain-containing protein [Lachnospiraceae bacterium]
MNQFKKYLILTDKEMNVRDCTLDFLRYTGRQSINNLDQVVPPQDMMQLRNAVFAIDPGNQGLICFRIRTSEGRLNWIAANVAKAPIGDEEIQIELSDIQSLKMNGTMAYYDKMTGLLNKQAITSYAQELTEQYPRKTFYFFLLDIDHFKSVNDTFGHMRGDEVIIEVAQLLRETVGDNGVVGRIGGDEFMMVLENLQTEPELRVVLGEIRDAVRAKYKDFGENLSLTVSMGGALFPDFTPNYDDLFKLADKMLYIAKMKGRDRYIIYTPSIHGPVDTDVKEVTILHRASEENGKTRMIMDFMSEVVRKKHLELKPSLEKLMIYYDLDEAYLFEGESTTSSLGLSRGAIEAEEDDRINETTFEMPILHNELIRKRIGDNQTAILNMFDLQRDTYKEIIRYMEQQEYRVIVIYHMKEAPGGGYMVFTTRTNSACRLSEADFSDLTYFAHMIELQR